MWSFSPTVLYKRVQYCYLPVRMRKQRSTDCSKSPEHGQICEENLGREYNYPNSCQTYYPEFLVLGRKHQAVQTKDPLPPCIPSTIVIVPKTRGRPRWHFIFLPLLCSQDTKDLAGLLWSPVFLTSHSRGYFDAFWHASWKHENQALVGTVYRKCKRKFHRISQIFFLQAHFKLSFHRSQRDTIQTPLLEEACTILLSLHKRFAWSSFLSLLLSKVFELAPGGGHFALTLFTALICYPQEREGTRSLCQLPSQISN